MIREAIVEQFHIITRTISPSVHGRLAANCVAAAVALGLAAPAAAAHRLQDPGPTLWALSIAPEVRVREAYLAAGGVNEVARASDVHWLAGAASRLLKRGPSPAEGTRAGSFRHARADVVVAIAHAARRTGMPSSWLLRTALRESGLDPHAVSSSSSAAGLFQFIETTWLRCLRLYGAAHGLAREAEQIELTSDGGVSVASAQRSGLLALRTDPRVAALMAAELARANRRSMSVRLARPVSESELYAAHFLGADRAVRLIRAAERTPAASALTILPRAAAANPSVFLQDGQPLTAADLLRRLERG